MFYECRYGMRFIDYEENIFEAFRTIEEAKADYLERYNVEELPQSFSLAIGEDKNGDRWYCLASLDRFTNIQLEELANFDDLEFVFAHEGWIDIIED